MPKRSLAGIVTDFQPAPPATVFTPDERDEIIRILSNPQTGPGTRAGWLLRKHGARLKFSRTARLLYVLVAGFIGVDKKTRPDSVRVPLRVLAGWLGGCSTRTVQNAVRELTRSGPLPLLLETPGCPGRASEFWFVSNPFAIAESQARDAEAVRKHRHEPAVRAQIVVNNAKELGLLSGAECRARERETHKRRDWNTATRPPVVITPSAPVAAVNPRNQFRP